jgi:GDP-L-fucose synthase
MTIEDWSDRQVLVTGGAGFIGSYVVEALVRRGVPRDRIIVPRSADCDLRLAENSVRAVRGCDVVFHLAADTGGIAFSSRYPASQFANCSLINLNVLEAAKEAGVKKIVALGNLLAYPASAESPLREDQLFNGKIAETHLGVGTSKRDLVSMAEMYHKQYGLDVVNVLSANAYGPRDRFDPLHAHVIPATIIKCFSETRLNVWGDGSPTRDFLYVEEIAEGLLLAAERLSAPRYVNLASGDEISIRDLVMLIAELTGFGGPIEFDHSKGGGDPRRVAAVEEARKHLGFENRTTLRQGLERTIAWYRDHHQRTASGENSQTAEEPPSVS